MSWGTQNSICFTVDAGKGRLNPSRDKKLRRKHRRRKVKNKTKTPVWPSSCVTLTRLQRPHIDRKVCSLTSRIHGMTTNKYYHQVFFSSMFATLSRFLEAGQVNS